LLVELRGAHGGDPADRCEDDNYVCDSAAGAVVCRDNVASMPDVCDGADNDCDPATPDDSGDPRLGDDCDGSDADLCAEGTKRVARPRDRMTMLDWRELAMSHVLDRLSAS